MGNSAGDSWHQRQHRCTRQEEVVGWLVHRSLLREAARGTPDR